MAAQLICNQWVAGSTPVTSSKKNRSGSDATMKERIGVATKEARKIMIARYVDSIGRMMRPGKAY